MFAYGEQERNVKVRYLRNRDKRQGLAHHGCMDSTPDSPWRLKAWREKLGVSQVELAAAAGTSKGYVSDLERGKRPFNERIASKLAAALGITLVELFSVDPSGPAPRARLPGYPLIGKVGAGGSGDYADDYELGAANDFVEPLPGMPIDEEIIVLDVEGDSMVPAVFDGDLAFFGPIRRDVEQLLNKRVMARLADGRKFFKILKRGAGPGLFTLRSLNPATPDIEDVKIEWVLPYRGSRPRD
jgi:transcriptional regulator with XRE-family HTH domain